jgi:hypothetical protein
MGKITYVVVLGVMLIAILIGGFYIGAATACQNGDGILVSGFKCVNTAEYIPVLTSDGKTVYVENLSQLPDETRVMEWGQP